MSEPAYLDVNPTLGALLAATLLACFLFGILTVQVNFYYSKFLHDPLWIKALVGFVWIVEFGHLVAICSAVHVWTISEYGKSASLEHPPNGLGVSILLSGLIAPVVQAYAAYRIKGLTKSIYGSLIAGALWFFALVRFGFSVALSAEALKIVTLTSFSDDFRWLVAVMLTVGTTADILVTAILYHLVKFKVSRTRSFFATVSSQFITYTVRKNVIIGVLSVAVLITFAVTKNAFIWHSLFVVLIRLFSNFFLSLVNSRSRRPGADPNQIGTESTMYTLSDVSTARFAQPSTKDRPTGIPHTDPLSTLDSQNDGDPETRTRPEE